MTNARSSRTQVGGSDLDRSSLPVAGQVDSDSYRLDAQDPACVAAVRQIYDGLENRIGSSIDTCEAILTVMAPMGEDWDAFLKKWSLTAMNSRTHVAAGFLFSGSSRAHGLFFIAMRA